MSDTRTDIPVTPTRPTAPKSSHSTVFPPDNDFQKATFTPDSPHTDTKTKRNITNTEDRPSSTQNIKGGDIRTSSRKLYTGGPVFYFLKNNVVPDNPDMNSYRKFRMRRRIFLLTVMTVGFFTTMVYSLLFSCNTVISADRAALPTRWEPGVGLMLSNTSDLSSATDRALPESDRPLPTSQSDRYDERRIVSTNIRIGSSEMFIVPSRLADRDSHLDREFPRKKFEIRKTLHASTPDTLVLSSGSPRSFVFDTSSQRRQTSILQQKVTIQHKKVTLDHVHHHQQTIQMQQDISRKQKEGLKSKQKDESRIIASLKARNGQGFPTSFHYWFLKIYDSNSPERKSRTQSSQEETLSTRDRMQHSVFRNTNRTMKSNASTPVNNGNYSVEDSITRVVPDRRVSTQILKDNRHSITNFIDFKNILSKSKTEKSAKSYSDSIDFTERYPTKENQRGILKTALAFNGEKQTLKQWKSLTLPTRSVNFNTYYYSGTRDRDSVKDILTPHGEKSQINMNTLSSNVPGKTKMSGTGFADENNVIYADKKKDYSYSLSDESQATVHSAFITETPVVNSSMTERTEVTKDMLINQKNLFVYKMKGKNNDSYFEYRDVENGNGDDYNVGDDAKHETEDVGYDLSDVNNNNVNVVKPRIITKRTATTRLTHSLSLPQRTSSSFSSKHDQLSTAVQIEKQSSLSPSSPFVAVWPSFSSVTQHEMNTDVKQSFSLSQTQSRKPTPELQASLKNQSASQSSSLSSLSPVSIDSVHASAPLTADKFDVGTPFSIEGHSGRALLQHDRSSRPSGIRAQTIATKKLPQAIIIGVKKGGTRAVLEFLRLHPNVRAPGPEPHFFDRHYQKGFDWYRNKMPATFGDQITIEKTPSYFVTKDVPRRIYNMSRDVKLIVVVRDPVTRAISDYTQTVSKRHQVRSFEQMVFINNTRIVDTSWGAIRIGVYAKHVSLWLKFFNLSQIHFVNGERLITDPAGEMAQLQDFLGLKRFINERHFYFNETKGFPCLKKPEGSGHPHCLGKTKGRTHPIISQKVLKRLRDFYRPFNSKFYHIVNKDFRWS